MGNKWLVRAETELSDGREYEEKGIIVLSLKLQSLYLRFWIGKTVIIVDSQEGFKKMKKNRNAMWYKQD